MIGRRSPWLLACAALLALLCAAAALFVPTDSWAAWFHHPSQSRPELTRQGAVLWRVMLGVNALVSVAATVFITTLSPGTNAVAKQTKVSGGHPRQRLLWVAAILVVALAFRATRLNESLWYDEIASWMTYTGGVNTAGAIMGSFLDPINHVAHTLLNWISVNALVSSIGVEPAFRMPALVFSLLSVVAMFGLGRAAFNEQVGFVAAGLTAVLPVSVLEGVEARGYSMMICFSAAMTWALLEARTRRQPWIWIVYACLCALGIWSHFVTAFVPIGHGAWQLWRTVRTREWRISACVFASLILAAIFTITLYAPMIPSLLAARKMFAAQQADQPTILGTEGWHTLLQLGGSWYWWAALPGLALFLLGLVAMLRRKGERVQAPGSPLTGFDVIALTMLGLALMLAIVIASRSWVYARFTFFALPGAVLCIAVAIDLLWNWRRVAGVVAMGAVLVMSITDLAIRPPKQPLRDAAAYVRDHRSSTDAVVALGLAHPVLSVYAADLNLTYSFWFGADLQTKLDTTDPRWVIVEYPNRVKPETYALLQARGFRERQSFPGWADWTQGDVIVMERSTGAGINHAAAPRWDPGGSPPALDRFRTPSRPSQPPETTR